MRLSLYLQSLFWALSLPGRLAARRARTVAAACKHSLSRVLGRNPRAVVVSTSRPSSDGSPSTEPILVGGLGSLPASQWTAVTEAARLVLATEPLSFAVVGSAVPRSLGGNCPIFPLPDGAVPDVPVFLRSDLDSTAGVAGKSLPWLPAGPPDDEADPITHFPFDVVGLYHLEPGQEGRRRSIPWYEAHRRLGHLEPIEGPPTILFLLPFLAVGGAERLLFDLLAGLDRYRCLVVTLEPHQLHLGQTVDRCAALTPWIFTLGDWLPRPAHFSALRHLIRRFNVEALMSWNGTVLFYDHAPDLRHAFPDLRILHQLYHFEGGWTARTTPQVVSAVDVHVAVNHPIENSLKDRLHVDPSRIAVIHHGVPMPTAEVDESLRQQLRNRWGIPENAVVAGTFIRLHGQKRPLDLLQVARRFHPDELWLVLMGDGPLSNEVAADLATAPIPNLVRIPMQEDPLPFYAMIDLCLMSSEYEGLPVFLLDGAARGLPGVAPSVGDIPLLFAGGGGLCSARAGDLDGLERDLRTMLDPELRRRAGLAARRQVEERFGLEGYVAAYERVLFGDTESAP